MEFFKMFEIIYDNLHDDEIVSNNHYLTTMMVIMHRNQEGMENPNAEHDMEIMKSITILLIERLKIVNPQAIWQILQLDNKVA